jgi:hypothetical protein
MFEAIKISQLLMPVTLTAHGITRLLKLMLMICMEFVRFLLEMKMRVGEGNRNIVLVFLNFSVTDEKRDEWCRHHRRSCR